MTLCLPFYVPIPATPALPASLTSALARLDREDLEAIVEAAIDLLDSSDGDVDLEDDDPAGDPLDERGEAQSDDGAPLLSMRPRYVSDQRLGPANGSEAYQAWRGELDQLNVDPVPYLQRFAGRAVPVAPAREA